MTAPWTLTITGSTHAAMRSHLFRGDGDEHGGVLTAGIASTPRGTRVLARGFIPAIDGVDFVPGRRGYRMLTAEFVGRQIRRCRDEDLVYLAVHNHGGAGSVGFSGTDLASHERGYPALLDISGQPVGALVLAEGALAGDIWTPDRERREISAAIIPGRNIERLHPEPLGPPPKADHMWDRQVRWFGDRGQALLGTLKVGVIGAGGVGLPLVTMLARVGIGCLVVVDPDRVDPTNLPRLDVRRIDALMPLRRIEALRPLADRLSRRKIALARRAARRANPAISFLGFATNVVEPDAAHALVDCDFLFLAADSHQARMVFNSLLHQYLIPGIQIGTRIDTGEAGDVTDIRSNVRLVLPDLGCLRCNDLISPSKLQEESRGARERERNRYAEELPAPSVISFNAMAAGQAMNDLLLMFGGVMSPGAPMDYLRIRPRDRRMEPIVGASGSATCVDCGSVVRSRFARGDGAELPLPQRA